CETPPRSLSSVGRIPEGPRRSRPIRGRLRCCIVCGPARCRYPRDGPARRRSRRTDPPRHPIGRSADGLSGFRRQRLFSAAVFASSVSFRAGPSVFKDPGKLSFDYLPDKLVHREKQTQRLFSLLRPIVEAMESLRKHLEKHKLHFIVILDEVDALLKKSGADLIYSFARIAEEGTTTKGNISMILISQRPNALEYMDPAALSTFRRTNVVEFPRYDRKELEDIVQGRVALAMHPGTVDDDLI